MLEALFLFSSAFTKISVLLFYRRLVAGTCSRRYKYALWIAIFIVVAYSVTFLVLLCVTCTPIQAAWRNVDPTYTEPWHCVSPAEQDSISKLGGALSVVTDFYSVLLPAVLVLQLKITRRQRLGLMAVFGVGFM